MKKAKVYKILSIVWFAIFVIFAVYNIFYASIICWDGIDKVTGRMTGGCYPDFGLGLMLLIFPFIFWLIVEIPLLILYSKNKIKIK